MENKKEHTVPLGSDVFRDTEIGNHEMVQRGEEPPASQQEGLRKGPGEARAVHDQGPEGKRPPGLGGKGAAPRAGPSAHAPTRP